MANSMGKLDNLISALKGSVQRLISNITTRRGISFTSIVYVFALLACTMCLDSVVENGLINAHCISWYLWAIFGITLITTIVALILIKHYEKESAGKVTRNEKMALLIQNSCRGRWADIMYVLAFLLYLNWLPNITLLCIQENNELSLIRLVVYGIGVFLLVYGKPTFGSCKDSKVEERTVLVSGLSTLSITSSGKPNSEAFFMPFDKFPNIEKVEVLLTDAFFKGNTKVETSKNSSNNTSNSNQSDDNTILGKTLKYKELMKQKVHSDGSVSTADVESTLKTFILECISLKDNYKGKDVEVIFSEAANYNSFEDCNNKSVQLIKSANKKGQAYKDENMVINITPGTSIVSSVMTLNSIKGDRIMVYVDQTTGELKTDETPSAMLVQFADIINDRN
jgi:hypothetical protein